MFNRSLTFQFLAFIILPLLALLLLISVGSMLLHGRAMRNVIGERDERAVRAAATVISEELNHLANGTLGVALQAQESDNPIQTITNANYLLTDFAGGLALYGRDGILLASSQSFEPHPAIDNWILAQENVSATFPQFHSLPDSPLQLIIASTRDYMAIGVIHPADIASTVLADLFAGNSEQAAFLVDDAGRILFERNNLHPTTSDLANHPGVAEASIQQSGTLYMPTGDSEHVVAYSYIPTVNWALVLEEPWQEVTDPMLRLTELAPMALMLALAIALVAVWLGLRQVVRPLQALSDKTTRLAGGDFAGMNRSVGGIQEIQHLQSALSQMSQRLQVAQAGLRGYLGAVTDGQEEERRRLARELHDDTMQSLIGLNQRLQLMQLEAKEKQLLTPINETQQMANQIIADLRRLIRDLRPIYLEDLGLTPALETLARQHTAQLDMPIHFKQLGRLRRLPAETEIALYRITQEALNNVGRHASASQVAVVLAFSDDGVTLAVQDDGRGFEAPAHPAAFAHQGHFGLLGMYERAELIAGKLEIMSDGENAGTIIKVNIPHH